MRRRRWLWAAVAIGCGLAWPAARAQTLNGFDLRAALVPVEAILQGGLTRDGITAIDRPRFVTVARSGLDAKDRVLGLRLGGDARAYPVRILNWHEFINDRVDGRPVAVTYCPLCGSGIAFDARVAGQEVSFGVSGLLYNSDMLLHDRGTQSLWSQIMGRAISGPRKGTPLASLPLTHTSWADWRAREPGTRVLSADTGNPRDYSRDPYEGYEAVPRLVFEVQHRDNRLYMKEWVLGVVVDGQDKAYPFERLARRLGNAGTLQDRFAGRPVHIRYHAGHRTAEAFDAEGRPLPSVTAYWFAWVAFHPQTELVAER
jgi:hypothetical protein